MYQVSGGLGLGVVVAAAAAEGIEADEEEDSKMGTSMRPKLTGERFIDRGSKTTVSFVRLF